MRDGRRIQERVEVKLERMQLIWLTLGGVVALGVTFALGMMMGKRAARMEAQVTTRDHVADIDEDGERHQELTFYNKLTAPAVDAAKTHKPAAATPASPSPNPSAPPLVVVAAPSPAPSSPAPAPTPSAQQAAAPQPTSQTAAPTHEEATGSKSTPSMAQTRPSNDAVSADANAPATTSPAAKTPTTPAHSQAASASTPVATHHGASPLASSDPQLLAELGKGPARRGEFTVQVSSFQTLDEAKAYAASLERKGYKPFVVSAKVKGKGTWYRVRIGTFKDAAHAQSAKNLLARNDIPAWILRSE
jgi:DedD protein